MKLVKAEILWTRLCPLRCSYCAMIDYPQFKRPEVEILNKGTDRLAALGCTFFAIYGASPLYDFTGLPEFIAHAEQSGISTTLIVDGVDRSSLEKLEVLHQHGLRSLTVSWDGQKLNDKSINLKSERGPALLKEFRLRHDDLRDVEVVSTLTKINWQTILESIPSFSADHIWFSFDFLHPDRGNPGTKCKGQGLGLRFESGDEEMVRCIGTRLLDLKQQGSLIHQSEKFLSSIIQQPTLVTKLSWKCTSPKFPAWLTIDADGSVLPCDDFWTDRSWKVWELTEERLNEFAAFYNQEVKSRCNGCMWSTHYDAVQIREADFVGLSQYKHEREV